MVHPALPKVTAYLGELSNASLDYFPGSILQGIQAIHVGKGIIECKLIIEDRVLGEDGTIHTGAIAAIMENIGATAIFSAGGSDHASVDFNYSLYSTAKKQVRLFLILLCVSYNLLTLANKLKISLKAFEKYIKPQYRSIRVWLVRICFPTNYMFN